MRDDDAVRRVAELGARNPAALNLARVASFAAQIDHKLLRTLRLELFPDSDASAEADLWFSPLVQTRSPKGFVLFPEVAELLRSALAEAEAALAWRSVQRCHRDSPAAVQIEEELNYLSLAPEANRGRIEHLLSSAVSVLLTDSGGGLSAWAGRMLPRLPRSLREVEPGRALGLASDVRLKRTGAIERRLRNDEALPPWLGQLFQDRSLVSVGISLTDLGLVFELGGEGGQRLLVPLTDPVVLELRWREGGHQKSKLVFVPTQGPSPPERVPFKELEVVTMKGDIWRIDAGPDAEKDLSRVVTVRASSAAYGNLLVWSDTPSDECLGYNIQRRARSGETVLLETRVGVDPDGPSQTTLFQGTSFIDSGAPREEVSYRVLPVHGTPSKHAPAPARSSNWTAWVKAGPDPAQPFSVYFNRGKRALGAFAPPMGETAKGGETSAWLGGDLLVRFKGLLNEAAALGGHVFGAFYDASDTDAVDAPLALGPRAHLVLSYSERPDKTKTALIRRLQDAGVEVVLRVGSTSAILHNKFFVVTNASKQPLAVWTGNTTISDGGFFERQSGAFCLREPALAAAYLKYWELLSSANAKQAVRAGAPRDFDVGRVWFPPGDGATHVEMIRAQIANAKEGVVFSVSLPDERLWEVLRAAAKNGIYVAGIGAGRGPGTVQLFDDGVVTQLGRNVLGPGAKQLNAPISFRAIAIDPFADSATLLLGSHSFTAVASRKNEENLVLLRGQKQITQQVAATIETWLSQFRFRARVATARSATLGFDSSDRWRESATEQAASPRTGFWLGHLAATRVQASDAPVPEVSDRVAEVSSLDEHRRKRSIPKPVETSVRNVAAAAARKAKKVAKKVTRKVAKKSAAPAKKAKKVAKRAAKKKKK